MSRIQDVGGACRACGGLYEPGEDLFGYCPACTEDALLLSSRPRRPRPNAVGIGLAALGILADSIGIGLANPWLIVGGILLVVLGTLFGTS